MKRTGGLRRKTRHKLKKNVRTKGKISLRRFFQRFNEGDKVYLFDFKTIASWSYSKKFGHKKDFDPSIHQELQLGTYGYAVKEEFGKIDGMYLIYYNKDNSMMNAMEVPTTYTSRAFNFWYNINEEHKRRIQIANCFADF